MSTLLNSLPPWVVIILIGLFYLLTLCFIAWVVDRIVPVLKRIEKFSLSIFKLEIDSKGGGQ